MKNFEEYIEELPLIKEQIESSKIRKEAIIDKPLSNREKGMVYKPFKEEVKRLSEKMKENREEIKRLKEENGMLKGRSNDIKRMGNMKVEEYKMVKNSLSQEFEDEFNYFNSLMNREFESTCIVNRVNNYLKDEDEQIQEELYVIAKSVLESKGYQVVNKNIKQIITRDDNENPEIVSIDSFVVIDPYNEMERDYPKTDSVFTFIRKLRSFLPDDDCNDLYYALGDYYLNEIKDKEDLINSNLNPFDIDEKEYYQPSFEEYEAEAAAEEDKKAEKNK